MWDGPDADADVVAQARFIKIADQDTLCTQLILDLDSGNAFHTTQDKICLGRISIQPGNLR